MVMAIVTLKEILEDAAEKKYGVGMFDIQNLEMADAVIEAAEEENAPVILALAEVHAVNPGVLEKIGNIMMTAARQASVPVAVHFDHGMNLDNIIRVLHLGFTSVMYDGSVLPYEENIKRTKEVVRFAKLFGASVEAELGHVGGAEGECNNPDDLIYTNPQQAKDFVKKTEIDALAVSIGTVHGVYHFEPRLDIERLREIKKEVKVPLVLHGGSGLSDQDFRNCIENGISKVNIYTEVINEAAKFKDKVPDSYQGWLDLTKENMKQVVKRKIQIFGSSGKA